MKKRFLKIFVYLKPDQNLVMLMTLILTLNADFYALKNKQRMESLQLKYVLLLQRYLK